MEPPPKRPKLCVEDGWCKDVAKVAAASSGQTQARNRGIANGRNAVVFIPVVLEADIDTAKDEEGFKPLYVHQIFAHDEKIPGWYDDLKIRIYYSVDSLFYYVDISGTPIQGTLDSQKDKLLQSLVRVFPSQDRETTSICRTREEFKLALDNDRNIWAAQGQLASTCSLDNGHTYDITRVRFIDTEACTHSFASFHRRLEWMLFFFIDAASRIDRDSRWEVYLIVRRETRLQDRRSTRSDMTGGRSVPAISVAGIATVYNFFGIPSSRRKVSQFFILPTFQSLGLGSRLLRQIVIDTIEDTTYCELTVEDPAAAFKQLRDYVELDMALESKAIGPSDITESVQELEKVSMDSTMAEQQQQLRRVVKCSCLQSLRLVEILALARILPSEGAILQEFSSNEESSLERRDTSEIGRAYRETQWKEEYNEYSDKDCFAPLRIAVKKRIKQHHAESFGDMTAEEVRVQLSKRWHEAFRSYTRTIWKIRKKMRGNVKESSRTPKKHGRKSLV